MMLYVKVFECTCFYHSFFDVLFFVWLSFSNHNILPAVCDKYMCLGNCEIEFF